MEDTNSKYEEALAFIKERFYKEYLEGLRGKFYADMVTTIDLL